MFATTLQLPVISLESFVYFNNYINIIQNIHAILFLHVNAQSLLGNQYLSHNKKILKYWNQYTDLLTNQDTLRSNFIYYIMY